MSEHPKSDRPENAPHPTTPKHLSDVDQYERLQNATERQMEKVWQAYERHSNLIKTVVAIAASLAAVLVTIGVFFFASNIQEFKEQLRQDMATNFREATNMARLDIENRFTKENIDSLIAEKATQRVKEVTDKIISNDIHSAIDPQLGNITNSMRTVTRGLENAQDTLDEMKSALAESKKSVSDVTQVADIAMTAIEASMGTRHAFDKLVEMRASVTNQYQPAIFRTVDAIADRLNRNATTYLMAKVDWRFINFNSDTASFEDYVRLFNTNTLYNGPTPALLLSELSRQDRFPRQNKLALYGNLIRITDSLELANQACLFVNLEAHTNLNILGASHLLDWVNDEVNKINITNCNDLLATNGENDTAYGSRGVSYCELGNYVGASNDFKKAIQLNPTNGVAYSALALLLATCGDASIRNGQQAVSLANKACELTHWDLWSPVGTLAAAYAEIGDFDKAVKFAKRALTINGMTSKERSDCEHQLSLYESKHAYHEEIKQ